jgi:sporulation protein YlmC with PRC-barrel domain
VAETQFSIGADASCTDGACGKVTRVVVDPVAQAVTHLVVDRHGKSRLVPLDLVDAAGDEIRLRCTRAEFNELEPLETKQFLPVSGGGADLGYGQNQMLWPYYAIGGRGPMRITGAGHREEVIESIPAGEVAVRRGQHVRATDGTIGEVQGLVIDPASHQVTHMLLQEGHLWGRQQITIPIGAVRAVEGYGVRLNITKQQVQDLPPVDIDHPGG